MAWVTPALETIWQAGELVGANRHRAVVQVQRGSWQRDFRTWTGPAVDAKIWGEGGYGDGTTQPGHWFPVWVPSTAWTDVPNLRSIKRTRDLTAQKGLPVLEVVLTAQDAVPKVGALGDSYHVFQPGYLVAERGQPPQGGRPAVGWPASSWTGLITDSIKIRVWQGYGKPESGSDGSIPPIDGGVNGAWTFVGQVDDVDVDSEPNQITLTARGGKLLSDQRTFGWAKSKRLPDPIAFFDSDAATQLSMVGKAARASSEADGHPASNVLDLLKNQWNTSDPAYATRWQSATPVTTTDLQYVEIRLPQRTYDEFWLQSLAGMFAYVGVFAHSIVHHTKDADGNIVTTTRPSRMREVSAIDGSLISQTDLPVDWIDLGLGSAPGANGGWPYIRTFTTGAGGGLPNIDRVHLWDVGSSNPRQFDLGERSILRVGFVATSGSVTPWVGDLHGLARTLIDDVEDQRYILVPDASDVVKVVLRWAGFQEWDVEMAGVRIADGTTYSPGLVGVNKSAGWLVFNRATFLIDIISEIAKQLGYIFFLADPKDGNSEGVPTFRRDSSLLVDNTYIAADLSDHGNLVGAKKKSTDSNRPYIIRYRGKTASAQQGGVPLGGDSIRRLMAVYCPPWAYGDRAGGIVRHVTFQDDQLVTYADCLMGCYLYALNAALEMYPATVELPTHPIIELDDQVYVVDEPASINSRMWVVKSEDTMTLGQDGSWKQTLQGSLLDTVDFWEVINGYTPPGRSHIPGVREIDWTHVTDPEAGDVSGSSVPILTGVSLEPRSR